MDKWLLLLLLFAPMGLCAENLSPSDTGNSDVSEEEKVVLWAKSVWDSLDRKTGVVELPNGVATLKVPDTFYYLNPSDAEKVLVEVWGNPPGSKTLGMLFPSMVTPFDNGAWAVTIEYEEDGYVSDEDADKLDYDELLAQMQDDAERASRERINQGYDSLELVGWAASPFYDKAEHKLFWAKELKFGSQAVNTLNYNIRILGRKGVLVLNFIAGMDQKAVIDKQLDTVLAMADFKPGQRYEEFNPELDKVAAYGIGALVAGNMLVKTGLLAAALMFFKKFGIFLVIGIGLLIPKLFRRKTV
ncbi:MAG: DUF2167 domain-containing protein [Gammaproteobacteria bacterium]|nr:DUF2167 domain-containing protein [Gammaproteobacteria bacterium]MDH5799949.1 DUF2167 domain-containing protein [Gammaproteobacteria bacterium]